LDYSEGAGIMENNMNVMYESVIYDSGKIVDDIPNFMRDGLYDAGYKNIAAKIIPPSPNTDTGQNPNQTIQQNPTQNIFQNFTSGSGLFNLIDQVGRFVSGVQQTIFPSIDQQQLATRTSQLSSNQSLIDNNTIVRQLTQDAGLLESVTKKALASGSFDPSIDVSNFTNFDSFPDETQQSIKNEVLSRINSGDVKLQTFASQIIKGTRYGG